MKQINDLLPHDPTTQPLDELGRMEKRDLQKLQLNLLKSAEMIRLWQMMAGMYLHKWTSAMGDNADLDGIWAAGLMNVTWEQIQHGFDQLVVKGFKWPPSLAEFHDLCLGIEEGVGVARAPSVAATTKEQGLRGITHKRSDAEIESAVTKIGSLRGLLK